MRLFFVTIIFAITLNSCGTSIPRSELQNLPSLIEIMGINMIDGQVKVRVSHRNNQTRKNNKLSCQLALKGFTPIKFNQLLLPDLTNYAVETIDLIIPPADLPTVAKFNNQMPYVLDCYLFSENFREEHLIKKSTLFKVPGSQGEYR